MIQKQYWHFAEINENGIPIMRDGTLIEIGKRYEIDGEIEMCRRGYHGSERAIDALNYAPGTWVSKRPLKGVMRGYDKAVGKSFVQQQGADATEVLQKFARMCALDVIYLWDVPDFVVRYLQTGDDLLKDAANAAARDAARDAASAAARNAAWTAASAARKKQNRRLTRMLNKLLLEATDVGNLL